LSSVLASKSSYELDVLKGVPVAAPAARRDGSYNGRVDFPEGLREAVLFTHADGHVRRTVEDTRRYGMRASQISAVGSRLREALPQR